MAYGDSFTPAGSAGEVKVRGPVWAGIWTFVTIGIYSLYWIYQTAKHLRDYGNAKGRDLGQNPVMTLLAIFPGGLIVIPALIAMWRQGKRIQQAQHLAGQQPMNGWLAIVLYIVFSPILIAYEQSELNKAWGAEGGPVGDVETYEAPALPTSPERPAGTAGTTAGDPLDSAPESPERPAG